jgi:nucleoside diphosphate kinase
VYTLGNIEKIGVKYLWVYVYNINHTKGIISSGLSFVTNYFGPDEMEKITVFTCLAEITEIKTHLSKKIENTQTLCDLIDIDAKNRILKLFDSYSPCIKQMEMDISALYNTKPDELQKKMIIRILAEFAKDKFDEIRVKLMDLEKDAIGVDYDDDSKIFINQAYVLSGMENFAKDADIYEALKNCSITTLAIERLFVIKNRKQSTKKKLMPFIKRYEK